MTTPPRLAVGILVSALIRRVQQAGGFAAVLHRGDETAGAILIECRHRDSIDVLIERASGDDGRECWRLVSAADESAELRSNRLAKRIRSDPDIWVIELDVAGAERFAAEMIGMA